MPLSREGMRVFYREGNRLFLINTEEYGNLRLRPIVIGLQKNGVKFFGVIKPG